MSNVKKHKPYFDIDCEEKENFNIIESDDEEYAAEFLLVNSDWPNLDVEDSDGASNAPVTPTIIDLLLLPNEQFYEFCSQLNEGQ